MKIDESEMVQFLALGLQIPADHPDRNKYYSMKFRSMALSTSDIAEITLMSPGDLLVLYTDGVYDGSDEQVREQLEGVLREHYTQPASEIFQAARAARKPVSEDHNRYLRKRYRTVTP
jgi:hypothetical protein